ncbi:MAG TPA: organomercurial lyase [Actinomycetes bacterium]|nr:organomercurial lyase [Actinomycetes bacterium]
MTVRTLTHGDPEQVAAALSTSPTPEPERQADAPAIRTLLAARAEGRPATVAESAAAAGPDPGEVAAGLRAWPDVEWDAEGRVTGLGMTLNPTPHQVETGAHRQHAWCAADALGMLPAIGRTVRVSSACPATGQTVTLPAGPDGVHDVQPPGAVVSVIITGDPEDIRGSMCNLGHFASPDAASGWASEHPTARC